MWHRFIPIMLISSNLLFSQEQPQNVEPNKEISLQATPEDTVKSKHSIAINGQTIPYNATVGTQNLLDDKGNIKAKLFFVAYTKEGIDDSKTRPITFCFNGGPGSSSVWLHLGILGPKRVSIEEDGIVINQPYHLKDNPYALLDVTDLVFIDPISTGYSRTVNGEDPKNYHGVEPDIKSISEFIRLFITRNMRWESPKFLIGESYGTTRAAGLALDLLDNHHMFMDGIIMISSALNFQTFKSSSGNDLPYSLFLPSLTAAALYHHRLAEEQQKDPQNTLKEAEEFALTDYTLALMQGTNLEQDKRHEIAEKLSKYTGLSPQYIEESNLRINIYRFAKQLLKEQSRVLGRFDSRVKGITDDPCADAHYDDPSLQSALGLFTPTMNNYVRKDLGWKQDQEYVILADLWPWNYGSTHNNYLDVTDKLRETMTKNPKLEVFVASSYYDLATPYFATQYVFSHLNLDPALRENVTLKMYDGGHMMYLYYPTLVKMKADLANFIEGAITKDFK